MLRCLKIERQHARVVSRITRLHPAGIKRLLIMCLLMSCLFLLLHRNSAFAANCIHPSRGFLFFPVYKNVLLNFMSQDLASFSSERHAREMRAICRANVTDHLCLGSRGRATWSCMVSSVHCLLPVPPYPPPPPQQQRDTRSLEQVRSCCSAVGSLLLIIASGKNKGSRE